MSRYRLLKASESDLESIWHYSYETWGVRQAGKYLRQIKKRIESIVQNPEIGLRRNEISDELYSVHEGHHLIFYRKEKFGIVIIRVLHERMDVSLRLCKDED